MAKAKRAKYYAYALPNHGPYGVTDNWAACEKMVSGKYGARFKSFDTKEQAEAWLAAGAQYDVKVAPKLEPGIYFDAGTGRGNGVEVSVTDEHGKDLLHKVISKTEINRFGKFLVSKAIGGAQATNNYGELLALRYALEIADKLPKAKKPAKIFGDSKLVIEYWSQWRIKRDELPEETVMLATEVAEMREVFEAQGGVIARISGDHNPADLGFHR